MGASLGNELCEAVRIVLYTHRPQGEASKPSTQTRGASRYNLRRSRHYHPLNPLNLLNLLNLLNPHVRILHRMRKSAEVGP